MIFNKIKENYKNQNIYSSGFANGFSNFLKTYVSDSDLLKETTYNKCIRYNGESVAKCSLSVKKVTDKGEIEAKDHKLYNILSLRANPYMTISDTLKTFVCLGEHDGISALYQDKRGYLYPAKVEQILVDEAGILDSTKQNPLAYILNIAGQRIGAFDKECVIYRSGISWDNVRDVNANKDYLQDSTATLLRGQAYLSHLFDNGMCSKVLVQVLSDAKSGGELKKEQDKFTSLFNTDGKIFVAPVGTNISTLNMSLADSQFKEIRSLSRIEIANIFGLTPAMIGEGQGDVEKDTIRYLQDTLLFKLTVLEQDLNYKLLSDAERKAGYIIKFNTNVILRTSPKVQQEIICEYAKNGVYSLEYARGLLGVTNDMENETVTLPSGQILLSDLKSGKATWQENKQQNTIKGGDNNE